jgi:class 3 adenylate cyclase
MPQAAQPTCFLIADISGYTGYLAGVELDHAQDILADLVGTVVTALRPNFRLAKLEGDAAFMSMTAEKVDGSMLLDTIERCYFGFRRRRRDVRQATSCECNACVRIPDLDLKFVVHHGSAIQQKVAGRQELLGSDVIVAHRLLKNNVVDKFGIHAYALISQRCIDAADIDPAALGMREHHETYDHIGEVPAWVHDLELRWQEEEARARVFVTPEEAFVTVTAHAEVPPQVAWEFLTKPGQRMTWQPWVTEVTIEGAAGGRRGIGSANHCMHGKDAVIEEILDWRPYDYVTDRTILATPDGPLRVLHTIELEPTTTGTTIHMRFAAPKTKREMPLMEVIGPAYGHALEANCPSLVAQLAAALAVREADRSPEPELAVAKPGGPLAGLEPLVTAE